MVYFCIIIISNVAKAYNRSCWYLLKRFYRKDSPWFEIMNKGPSNHPNIVQVYSLQIGFLGLCKKPTVHSGGVSPGRVWAVAVDDTTTCFLKCLS